MAALLLLVLYCPLLSLPAFFLRVPGGEAGAFSSPTGGGARLAERPLRFGPYSRALITATAPPASIRLRRMAGWRRRVARLGLGLLLLPPLLLLPLLLLLLLLTL